MSSQGIKDQFKYLTSTLADMAIIAFFAFMVIVIVGRGSLDFDSLDKASRRSDTYHYVKVVDHYQDRVDTRYSPMFVNNAQAAIFYREEVDAYTKMDNMVTDSVVIENCVETSDTFYIVARKLIIYSCDSCKVSIQ